MTVNIPVIATVGALPNTGPRNQQQFAEAAINNTEFAVDADETQGSVPPTSNTVPIFLLKPQNVPLAWSTALGKYVPLSSFNASIEGDVKLSFDAVDSYGWFVCDGRVIAAILDATPAQRAILTARFTTDLPDFNSPVTTPDATPTMVYLVYTGSYEETN